jgi:hypothetical protein
VKLFLSQDTTTESDHKYFKIQNQEFKMMNAVTPFIPPEELILPRNALELVPRAKKFGLLNNYETPSEEWILAKLGHRKRDLVKWLISWSIPWASAEDFALRIKTAIQLAQNSDLNPDLVQTMTSMFATQDNPWMEDCPFANMPKCIQFTPIGEEAVNIEYVDYGLHTDEGAIFGGGVQGYIQPLSPQAIYDKHVQSNPDLSDFERTIITRALDQKPYHTNSALMFATVDNIKKIRVERERAKVSFEGDRRHSAEVHLFDALTKEQDKQLEELLRQHGNFSPIENILAQSPLFQSFTPDFVQHTQTITVL